MYIYIYMYTHTYTHIHTYKKYESNVYCALPVMTNNGFVATLEALGHTTST